MAKAATKQKVRAANVGVPQSRQEAAGFIRSIGEEQREIGRLEADMNDELARIKERYENLATPRKAVVAELVEGLRIWCEANRAELTNQHTVKYADLGTGKVLWRLRPPKVTIRKAEDVIRRLKEMGLRKFLRMTEEVDKEAMLKDADKARTVAGVTIGSEGEDFSVEPFEAAIEGVAA